MQEGAFFQRIGLSKLEGLCLGGVALTTLCNKHLKDSCFHSWRLWEWEGT